MRLPNRNAKPIRAAVLEKDTRSLVAAASGVLAGIGADACAVLASLGSVGRIAISDWTPTACIERRSARFTIRFNSRFLEEHVENDVNFAYILSHEILHLCLGHLTPAGDDNGDGETETVRSDRLYGNVVKRIAADMQVTKALHAIWGFTPEMGHRDSRPGLISALLSTPEAILGTEWRCGQRLFGTEVHPHFSDRASEDQVQIDTANLMQLTQLYCDFWESDGMTLKEIEEALTPALIPWRRRLIEMPPEFVLLGLDRRIALDDELVGRLVDKLPIRLRQLLQRIRNGQSHMPGHSDKLAEHETEVGPRSRLVQSIARALRERLKNTLKEHQAVSRITDSAIPLPLRLGRREALFLSIGHAPALYPFGTEQEQVTPPLFVYVDVSGSTEAFWSSCIEALRLVFQNRRTPHLWQFSNRVVPLGLTTRSDKVTSTGGTDFNCVVEHAIRRLSPHLAPAFVLTDGYAGLRQCLAQQAAVKGISFWVLLLNEYHRNTRKLQGTLTTMFGPCLAENGIIDLSVKEIASPEHAPFSRKGLRCPNCGSSVVNMGSRDTKCLRCGYDGCGDG